MTETFPLYTQVDNAAQIFVSINSKKETTMSRIAATFKDPIDREKLETAFRTIIKRFPFFQVYLKKTFFEYIFKHTENIPEIEEDSKWTNRYVNFNKENFLFRIKASEKTLAAECSHILSDGFGTMSLLASLIAEYCRLNGQKVADSIFIKEPGETIPEEEWECAFRKQFSTEGPSQKIPLPAYIPPARMIPVEKYYSTRIIMDLDPVREQARGHHVTMNVYMSSIYASALQAIYLEDLAAGRTRKGLPLRLQIPVNMRKDYPTSCLKNFSYLYSPVFYPGKKSLSFEEIIEQISADIRHERHTHHLEHQISRNLRAEKNIFFRFTPRLLKTMLFKVFYHLFARSQYSGVITNLGDIRLPETLTGMIESFEIIPCNSPVPGRNTSLFSYQGILEMNIGSSCEDLRLEKKVLEQLKALGIEYRVLYKRD